MSLRSRLAAQRLLPARARVQKEKTVALLADLPDLELAVIE